MAVLVSAKDADSFEATLETRLLADLRQSQPQGPNHPVQLARYDANGALVAGLGGSTSYGWLLIKLLWVDPAHRRRGHARTLVRAAIEQALSLGCHGAWLDTSNAAARQFYHSEGFNVFATLENAENDSPAGHTRWFMRKALNRQPG